MEISNQGIYHLKLISRINENFRPAAFGLEHSVFICSRLQSSAAGSAHRNHSSPIFFRIINEFRLLFFYHIKLGMHMMFLHIIYLYRPKGSKPHMKRHMGDVYSHILDLLQQFFRKVKSRSRSRSASFVFCIDGLVALFILQFMGNIRRQRHLTQLIQYFFKNPLIGKLNETVSLFYNIQHFSD